jgi:hypothetical protein
MFIDNCICNGRDTLAALWVACLVVGGFCIYGMGLAFAYALGVWVYADVSFD